MCRQSAVFLLSFFTMIFSGIVSAHVAKCSAFGAYTDLIQTIDCPSDQATYGSYNNYGFYEGGHWCGQNTVGGYWVYNYPTWHIYKNKVQTKVDKKSISSQVKKNTSSPGIAYSGKNWSKHLKGKHLLYIKTTAYTHNKWHFWLCSNQQFRYSAEGGAVDVGAGFSAASQGNNSGQWKVSGDQLTLQYGSGSIEKYNLSYSGEFLYLNNTRYFLVENNHCN
jgi:hypothetical protein